MLYDPITPDSDPTRGGTYHIAHDGLPPVGSSALALWAGEDPILRGRSYSSPLREIAEHSSRRIRCTIGCTIRAECQPFAPFIVRESACNVIDPPCAMLASRTIVERLYELLPHESENTIRIHTWKLPTWRPQEVYKPARGIFRLARFHETEATDVEMNGIAA